MATRSAHFLGGSQSSPQGVTLTFCADFECPYSANAYPTVRRLKFQFGARLRVAFRHFPMPELHPDAVKASHAAEAAAVQGKFEEMVSVLFENQTYLSREDLLHYASKLGLDEQRFRDDLDSEGIAKLVRDDVCWCERNGVWQTPSFFIEDQLFEGQWSLAALKKAIQRRLEKLAA